MDAHDSTRIYFSGASESGTFIWNIRERFNIQVELGSGQYSWKIQEGETGISGKANGGILWSGDAKLIIFNVRDLLFAMDAKAGGWDWMTGPSSRSLLRYWQLGIAFTQKIAIFSPYIGCAINRTRSKLSTRERTIWLHERHHVGPFAGCSISRGNWFLANLEWRGYFEEGVTLGAQVRF